MSSEKSFIVTLSHSNRPVDLSQCSLDYLTTRYADPERLTDLPPLETLEPLDKYRHRPAGMSVLRLTLAGDAARFETLTVFDPPGLKVQHACLSGSRLVVCLEDALLVFDGYDPASPPAELDITDARRIDDPWFSGLHTVIENSEGLFVLPASAPDGIMEVDIDLGRVVRRVRLPQQSYGLNFEMTEASDLRAHYVHNDLQVAHINCAAPDGDGNVLYSTLIQGDVAALRPDGSVRILTTGHVGAHGVRPTRGGTHVYFSDACRGELVQIDWTGRELHRYGIDSLWLHDIEQVTDALFLFSAADHNALHLVDTARGRTLLTQRFDERGGAVQFVSVHPEV